jgi:hypothetical protein
MEDANDGRSASYTWVMVKTSYAVIYDEMP